MKTQGRGLHGKTWLQYSPGVCEPGNRAGLATGNCQGDLSPQGALYNFGQLTQTSEPQFPRSVT